MEYEIVWVETPDELTLYGALAGQKTDRAVLINIHGTASNFYDEDFIPAIAKELQNIGISLLSTNNRGAYVLEAYQKSGAAVEHFEDCVIDIDLWVEFALKRGYKKIFLSGHSLGTEKVIYYMNKGKHRDKVAAVILLAPADSYGSEIGFLKDHPGLMEKLLAEAESLMKEGKGHFFLTTHWLSHADALPKTADSYLNFFKNDLTAVAQSLPLRNGQDLAMYRKIEVPILVVIGDNDEYEYTIIPIKEALDLMRKENPMTEAHQLANCNHDFEGKEEELATLTRGFIARNL